MQVEATLTQSMSLLSCSFDSLPNSHQMKSFKRLLYMDLADVVTTTIPIPHALMVNHVLQRSAIPAPTALCGWSEIEYVNWMDSHNDIHVKDLLVKCCDSYLFQLEQAGVKETCLEHPAIRKLLLDWNV
jgi:hypothetical protein